MAAPCASSFKALRNLQRSFRSTPARRALHVTGANPSSRPYESRSKHVYTPLSLPNLRSECRKRYLNPTGSRHDLIDRLSGHDSLQARAFSIAMKRVVGEQTRNPLCAASPVEQAPKRHFNTSRTLKGVNDSSTIDFAYLPRLFELSLDPKPTEIRVPILHHVESDDAHASLAQHPDLDHAAGGQKESEHSSIMKPQIVTVTETLADGAHVDLDLHSHASPMSDVADNHSIEMGVDALSKLAHTVGQSARGLVENPTEQGTMSRIWQEFLDDLFGEKRSNGPKMT